MAPATQTAPTAPPAPTDSRQTARPIPSPSLATDPPPHAATPSPPRPKTAILAAIRDLHTAIATWENNDGPYTDFQGQPVKDLPEGFGDLLDALLSLTSTTDLPPDCYSLALAADDVEDAAAAYFTDRDRYPDHTPPGGSVDMWTAWHRLTEAARLAVHGRPAVNPPNIDLELRRGTTPEQLGRMMGWYLLDPLTNEPIKPIQGDAEKVREEHLQPGRHFDAAKWQAPSDQRRHARLTAQFTARNHTRARQLAERAALSYSGHPGHDNPNHSNRPSRPNRPIEPIEDLARLPGMSVEQIARMHRTTPEAVRDELQSLGLILEPAGLRSIGPATPAARIASESAAVRRELEEDQHLANFDPHDEHGPNIEQRILSCHQDGMTPQLIGRLLSRRTQSQISTRRVNRVIADATTKATTEATGQTAGQTTDDAATKP